MATILVVDDDSRTRQLYSSLLTSFGHNVHEAADGRIGLKLAAQEKPGLILSDILMPTMNGYEFVSSLRKLPGLENTPVIFQSASFLDHQSRALGAQCGVQDFLSKPCEPEKILETVNRVLGLPSSLLPSPTSAFSHKDPIPDLIDAFYEKGQQLDAVSMRLAAILDLGLQISQTTLPQELLEKSATAARKIIGSHYAVAAVIEPLCARPKWLATSGLEPATATKLTACEMRGALKQISVEARVFRVFSQGGEPMGLDLPACHPHVRGFLGVPLLTSTCNYGLIYVANKLADQAFNAEDERILITIAAKLALAYENILRYQAIQAQTEKLEHEIEQRKRAEERFRLLIETAPTGILICDGQGHITEGNAQLQRMFGYTREQLIGQPIEMLVPEQHRGAHVNRRTDYSSHPQARPMGLGIELHARRKDGTTFPVEISLGPLATDEGMLISSTVVDITERKKLERQVQVSQRLESVGQLAAGIAHDFNNILTAISGNTKLALSELSAEHPARENLSEIEKGSSRATKLVRQILTFSRQDGPKRETVKLTRVVEEALKLLRAGLPAKIEIRTQFDEGLPDVAADSTQIHQIVMNIGTNAAHAMEEHGGTLQVCIEDVHVDASFARANPDLHEGKYALLSVSDSGCGMERAVLERIFEPFYTTKPKGEGTGLGLSVVHGIMKTHGGTITVNSEVGKGTVFQLYFPATGAAVEEVCPRSLQADIHGHGERILYVDDEEPLILLMTRMLGKLGYSVTGCTDPEKAIAIFRSQPDVFDVVVSDLSMPGMTGIDLAREILQIRPGMPVLIASGYIRPVDNAEVRTLGLPDLILKPDTVEQMGEILHVLFEKTEARTVRRKAASSNPT